MIVKQEALTHSQTMIVSNDCEAGGACSPAKPCDESPGHDQQRLRLGHPWPLPLLLHFDRVSSKHWTLQTPREPRQLCDRASSDHKEPCKDLRSLGSVATVPAAITEEPSRHQGNHDSLVMVPAAITGASQTPRKPWQPCDGASSNH